MRLKNNLMRKIAGIIIVFIWINFFAFSASAIIDGSESSGPTLPYSETREMEKMVETSNAEADLKKQATESFNDAEAESDPMLYGLQQGNSTFSEADNAALQSAKSKAEDHLASEDLKREMENNPEVMKYLEENPDFKAIYDDPDASLEDLENVQRVANDDISKAKGRYTVLPDSKLGVSACKIVINDINNDPKGVKEMFQENFNTGTFEGWSAKDILSCGIKTGSIRLWMIPYYIRYILEFVIQLSGLICIGGIIYGGYLYMFAGVMEEKDKGKNAIVYSIGGMVLTLVAWAIVNIVISIVTSI